MNPQQPMQDSGTTPPTEQPFVGGEPLAAAPVAVGQPVGVQPAQPEPFQASTAVPVGQVSPQPVESTPVQPVAQPVMTPSVGLAPSSPGIPTNQPVAAPVPAQSFVGGGGIGADQMPEPAGGDKKKKLIKFGVIGTAVFVLLAASIFGFVAWSKDQISLTTYDGEGYTISVPEGYIDSEENGGMIFEEDTDDKASQSTVFVGVEPYEEPITKEQLKEVKTLLTEDYVKSAFTEGDDSPLKGATNFELNTEDTEGSYVISGTADTETDGQKSGKAYIEFSVTDKAITLVYVVAHDSDQALAKNAQVIIDSLKVE